MFGVKMAVLVNRIGRHVERKRVKKESEESGIKSSSKSHSPEHASRVGDGGDGLIAKYLPLKFS